MNRNTVAGSTLATLVLGVSLLRIAGPTSQLPVSSTVAAAPYAPATLSRGTAKPVPKETGIEQEGPWRASQGHYAGMFPNGACPTEAVGAFDRRYGASGKPTRQEAATVSAGQRQLWCIPEGEHVRAMIAILPDPVNSHLALFFDRTVEAIQLAAQDELYVVDRYWLPWDVSPPRTDRVDYNSLQAAISRRREKEKQPGLLLFRWNRSPEEAKKKRMASV